MEKIELPIGIDEEDTILPSRPDLQWLFIMLGIVSGVLIGVFIFTKFFASFVIAHMDIEMERKYFGGSMIDEKMHILDFSGYKIDSLSSLSHEYPIYIANTDIENAYATLGADIIVTQKLLGRMENLEELVFVIGHERSHIIHRHIIQGFAQSMPLTLTLYFLGIDGSGFGINIFSLLSDTITRDMERSADDDGIYFMNSLGMNLECAIPLFERDKDSFENYTLFLSDHPTNQERIYKMRSGNKNAGKTCQKMNK